MSTVDTPDSDLVMDAEAVVKNFGDVRALDGFDMTVEAGRVHGLVGPNGAGKTTFLRILFGLVAADAGSITLLGRQFKSGLGRTMPGVAGFVEDPRFYPYLSARRNLELLAKLDGGGHRSVDEVLDLVRLSDAAGRKVGGFSSGMRQRLGLAASLLRSPRLLLLDEPTVGLDPAGAREAQLVIRKIPEEGCTVVLSSHNMTELQGLCDNVTVMREGTAVWHGSMAQLEAEAPAAAHRMWTSDDSRAFDMGVAARGIDVVADPDGGLVVTAERDALDAFVIRLAQSDLAVRRLELLMTPLESLFFALTGARSDRDTRDPSHSIEASR